MTIKTPGSLAKKTFNAIKNVSSNWMNVSHHHNNYRIRSFRLSKKTFLTINGAAPYWLKMLHYHSYNLRSMPYIERVNMQSYANSCLIGEVHGGHTYHCKKCITLAKLAPYVFNSKLDHYTKKYVFESIPPSYREHGFAHTATGIKKYMDYVARHIEKAHPELIR